MIKILLDFYYVLSERELSYILHLKIQANKNAVFLIISYVFSATKLKKRAEQVLPGSERGEGGG
jgi:hypothetical protein